MLQDRRSQSCVKNPNWLGCNVALTAKTLITGAACSSKTSVPTHRSTWHNIPEDWDPDATSTQHAIEMFLLSCTAPFPAQPQFLHSPISCTAPFPAQPPFMHSSPSCTAPFLAQPPFLHSSLSCTAPFPAQPPFLHSSLSQHF
jgi:hypothetical protein